MRAIERSSTFTPASGPVEVLEEEAAVSSRHVLHPLVVNARLRTKDFTGCTECKVHPRVRP